MLRVEVLWCDGCPGRDEANGALMEALARHGSRSIVEYVQVKDSREAERRRFRGSPTIQVDGRDVESPDASDAEYGLACRLYPSPEGLLPWPSQAVIRRAIERSRAGGAARASGREDRPHGPCQYCGARVDARLRLAGERLCWDCFDLFYLELGVGA